MPNRYEEAAKRAAEKTDREFVSEISGLTRLTEREVAELFPKRADMDRLMELMVIVNSASDEHTRVVRLKQNIEGLAGTVLRLVKLLV